MRENNPKGFEMSKNKRRGTYEKVIVSLALCALLIAGIYTAVKLAKAYNAYDAKYGVVR